MKLLRFTVSSFSGQAHFLRTRGTFTIKTAIFKALRRLDTTWNFSQETSNWTMFWTWTLEFVWCNKAAAVPLWTHTDDQLTPEFSSDTTDQWFMSLCHNNVNNARQTLQIVCFTENVSTWRQLKLMLCFGGSRGLMSAPSSGIRLSGDKRRRLIVALGAAEPLTCCEPPHWSRTLQERLIRGFLLVNMFFRIRFVLQSLVCDFCCSVIVRLIRTDTDDHPASCLVITAQWRLQDAAACVGAVCFCCSPQQTRWVEVEVGGEQHQNNPDPKNWIKHPRDFIYILSWGLQREAEDGWMDGWMDGWIVISLSCRDVGAAAVQRWKVTKYSAFIQLHQSAY